MPQEDLSKLKIDRTAKAIHPRRRKKRLLLIVALLLAMILGVLYINGILSPAIPVEIITVAQIYPSQTLSLLNASGYVVAQRKAAVASKITGRLIELLVEEGSQVKEGQLLARLEREDSMASRNQAEANLKAQYARLEEMRAELEDATRVHNRNTVLIERRVISRFEVETSEARYKRAMAGVAAAEANIKASQAALQGAQVAIEYANIRAPFDGVVLTKNADVGDIVTPLGAAANAKAAVVTMADLRSLQVEADVSESNLRLVKVGQPCEIQLDALPDMRFRGVLHAIVPTADRSKATIMVKVRFLDLDQRILPEMRAKVAFLSREIKPEEQRPRTTVNPTALVGSADHPILFVVRGDKVLETQVRKGEVFSDMVEILEGVSPGERVVNRPPKRLKNGSAIEVPEK